MLLALLLLPSTTEGMTLPTKSVTGVTASLAVYVAEQTPQPGTARVRLSLTAEGPADLAVEGPWLEDALSAWRVALRTSSYRLDERCRWEYDLELVQVKPGVVPLPGVRLRVQSGGSTGEIAWPDLLNEPADVASVVEVPSAPPSPWPKRLRWAGYLALGLLGLAGGIHGVRRWARRPEPSRSPLAVALTALDHLQASHGDPLHLIAGLDGALRAYLETRGIPALRLTGVELQGRLQEWPEADKLTSILVRGEELKFAGGQVSKVEAQELTNEARQLLLGSLEKIST